MKKELNILQNFEKNHEAWHNPFPHIVIHDALPNDIYEELSENYPATDVITSDNPLKNNYRYQLSINNTWRNEKVAQVWQDFAKYHTSQTFYEDVLQILGPFLPLYYHHLGNLFSRETIWRNKGVKRFSHKYMALDCQIGINSPVLEPSTVIGPHLDNPVELYAGLFYLRHPQDDSKGGHLLTYEQLDKNKRYKPKTQIPEQELQVKNIIPYEKNMFALIFCTPNSIHGVTPRSVTPHCRRLVNIIAESSEDLPCVINRV